MPIGSTNTHKHDFSYDTFLCRICGKSRKEVLAEYSRVVDKHFWSLVDDRYQRDLETPVFRSLTHLDSYREPEMNGR